MSGRKEKLLINKLERLASRMVKTAMLAVGKPKKANKVDIFLLDDDEMKRLKRRFLPREKGPANVLSFAEPADWPRSKGEPKKLGEVYLNTDLAESKMDNSKELIASKLIPLLLHGVLHLLGYDHKKKNDRIKMEKLEKRIISNFQNTNLQ